MPVARRTVGPENALFCDCTGAEDRGLKMSGSESDREDPKLTTRIVKLVKLRRLKDVSLCVKRTVPRHPHFLVHELRTAAVSDASIKNSLAFQQAPSDFIWALTPQAVRDRQIS